MFCFHLANRIQFVTLKHRISTVKQISRSNKFVVRTKRKCSSRSIIILVLFQSLLETSRIQDEGKLSELRGTMEYDLPNRNLYEFRGTLQLKNVENPIFVTNKQILLRGAKLENTKWIFGLVVYTGHESKLMMVSISNSFIELVLDFLI